MIIIYEWMIRDKKIKDELVNLYMLNKNQWILVYHENS